ncbi:hypothetical protein CVT25_001198 [Psilocybe cyanescens]|uniref:Uncharacterized protein n=1 Tax=Psilocybe cyanescens TaxID=93625 RepID=A0A409XB29_PSICY|nr:hypothetical protein CVT25_001198 [Psilocybe cyanescens]
MDSMRHMSDMMNYYGIQPITNSSIVVALIKTKFDINTDVEKAVETSLAIALGKYPHQHKSGRILAGFKPLLLNIILEYHLSHY